MSTRRTSSPSGSLAEHGPGFRGYLFELGYSVSAAKKHLQLLGDLSRWLEGEGISIPVLAAASTEEFFRRRRAQGRANLRTPRSLDPLLAYLRRLGVIEAPPRPVLTDPVDVFIDGYHGYLTVERGLVEGTARFYLHVARLFVSERRGGEGIDWRSLRAVDVTGFTTRVCGGRGVSSARQVVSALRCLMRYVRLEGLTGLALDDAVFSVAGWNSSLPRGISPAAVTALLSSCDRRRPIGRRDYAILMLLCRLGLRGGEVVSLSLDDIDWRAGEIVVAGKGGRRDRLPLPADVGAALVDYLRQDRHRVQGRIVFVRQFAPIRGLAGTGAIRGVLARACHRAGIPYVNPHRLRHTLASEMLAAGVALDDIGQVLGHRGSVVTATYAKVDLQALRSVVRRWPEVSA
ncbi:MAG: site-specific integrase [Pseudonocardiaceae bacterium]